MPRDPDWSRDELLLAVVLVANNNWKWMDDTDRKVIELSNLLQNGPTPLEARTPKFRNLNSVRRKTGDFASNYPDYSGKPTNSGQPTKDMIAEYLANPAMIRAEAAAVHDLYAAGESLGTGDQPPLDVAAEEGGVLLRSHIVRERDRKLRGKKLDAVVASGGKIACEVCELNPAVAYPGVADPRSLVDVHHIVPLHVTGKTTTRLADLVVLCPSCHRAVHASRPWLTPEQLRDVYSKR